jgi:hypothetical protein
MPPCSPPFQESTIAGVKTFYSINDLLEKVQGKRNNKVRVANKNLRIPIQEDPGF